MLEIPLQFPVIRVDRDRRVGVKTIAFCASGQSHPRLRLGRSPERQIQSWIVTAGDPHFTTSAIFVREIAPGFGSFITGSRDRVEAPELFAGLGIVSAHEAFLFLIALASAESFEHFS